MLRVVIHAFAFFFVTVFGVAHAEDRLANLYEYQAANAESYRLDLTVPESPAFAILGLDSPEVATPRDMPTLATELASFFDDGVLQPGGAITVQPYWLGNRNLTIDEYRGRIPTNAPRGLRPVADWERRWIARTSVSAALAEVEGQDDAVRLGLGLTFRPLNSSDPRFDDMPAFAAEEENRLLGLESLASALTEAQAMQLPMYLCLKWVRDREEDEYIEARADEEARATGETNPDRLQAEIQRRERELRNQLSAGTLQAEAGSIRQRPDSSRQREACVENWRKRQAERPNLLISIGQTYLSDTGATNDLDSESLTAWAGYSMSVPVGRVLRAMAGDEWSSRLNLYARFAESERVALDVDTMADAEVAVAAVSFSVTLEEQWSLGVEAAYRTEDFSTAEDREFTQVALNGSYRLNDQMWLRGSYGTRGDDESEFVRISLVFAERAED